MSNMSPPAGVDGRKGSPWPGTGDNCTTDGSTWMLGGSSSLPRHPGGNGSCHVACKYHRRGKNEAGDVNSEVMAWRGHTQPWRLD